MRRELRSVGAVLALAAITLVVVFVACQPQPQNSWKPSRHSIVVYAFSVEEEVLTKEIFPAFENYWQQQIGEEVDFQSVFTGSEEIDDAILSGAPADIAILSNEQHAVWLHINDQVTQDWRDYPHQGVISQSPLVIVVRPDNPLGIRDWRDLARPGVRLVHANPRTSGGAQWAILAEYGSALQSGADREAAETQLRNIWANVISCPSSSREAMREFLFGVGDALVTYEQDALLAESRGADIDIIAPRSTILSEHVVVVVDSNVRQAEQQLINGFLSFLWTETAQQALIHYYFRPITPEALDSLAASNSQDESGVPLFPTIEQTFTVEYLGGWGRVYQEIIQGVWEEQIADTAPLQ